MLTLFSHVGVVVHDIDQALVTWRDALGLTIVTEFLVEEEGVRSVMLSTGGAYGDTTCVELVQPLRPEDLSQPIARRLAEKGEGIFHLAFRTDAATTARRSLDALGVRNIDPEAAGDEVFPRTVVPPASTNGVLIEILADGA